MEPDGPECQDGLDDEEEVTAATLRGRPRPLPLSALSAFSYVPPRRLDPEEHSYYLRRAQVGGLRRGRRVRPGRRAGSAGSCTPEGRGAGAGARGS